MTHSPSADGHTDTPSDTRTDTPSDTHVHGPDCDHDHDHAHHRAHHHDAPVQRDQLDLASPSADPFAEGPVLERAGPIDLPQAEIDRITDDLITAFKTVYDPEIPVDIFELGLIYKVDLKDGGHVDIDMTLTAPACPAAGILPGQIEDAAKTVEGIASAKAFVTFDPPWTQARMSDEARLALNMY